MRRGAEDALYSRYLTIANRFNARVCDQALDVDRQAISKLVNMLSFDAVLGPPVAIDQQQLIYRIDLRDYFFDRVLAVDGQLFVRALQARAAARRIGPRRRCL